jgi:hypothetical protein
MQVAKKQVIVNAELFQWGMESGVCRYNMFIPKENNEHNTIYNSNKHLGYLARHDKYLDTRGFDEQEGYVPYIATSLTGYVRVKEGDYIITESKANGTVEVRYPISAQQFQNDFEIISQ